MDRLDAWRLFVRVAETGAFSRAAADLGLSQPQVSRAIAALEAQTGARLLLRTTRRVTVTEAGERALVRARALLEEADALDQDLRGADAEPLGLLRIGASIAHARAELTPHARDFLTLYPRVRLDFATSDQRIDVVAEGIDLVFRLGALEDSALTARGLGAYRRMLVAAPSVIERFGPFETPRDVEAAPCIQFTSTTSPRAWTLNRGDEQKSIAIDGPVRASTGRVIRDLAIQGLGIALAPCFLVRRDIASGALVQILADWRGPAMPLTALWASGRSLPRKARVFLDFIIPRLTAS
jgi:DNA-binding transcriptional LysR family regulator